jgi:hypothetical protein
MKTFGQFIIEARDAVKDATYTGDAAEQERIKARERRRGFDPDKEKAQSRESARKAREEFLRNKSKNTTVPGGNKADSPFGGKPQPQPSQPSGGPQQTQTPPKSSTPPPPSSNPPKSSTPPSQPSGGSGGRGTPPPPPSSSTTTPSSGRRPNPYRATGTGRTEIPRSTTNPGKGPGAFQTVKNNAKNIKNFKPGSVPGLKSGAGLSAAYATGDEKMTGSGWRRSLAKGATVAAGTVLGGLVGGAAGTAVAPGPGTAIGGYTGQAAGSAAAGKAFDTVAGKNAAERAADRLKNRQRQAGGSLIGIGGKTTFDTKKNTMTTGSGAQKKTVGLAKTSVVKDPKTGKAETGFLAYKGGKAIYKRPAKPGEGSSNALERIGRAFNPDAYTANDAKLAAQKLKQASSSDIKRQQALGVKGSKNLVGPKIVGPKPEPPKPPAGGGMGGKRGSRA